MTRERFDPAATNMLVAQGIDVIVHIAATSGNRRIVTSIREVTGADRDLVSTNEIYGPDESGRAAPRFTFSPSRLERLEQAGFDRRWLTEPGRWVA